MTALIRLLGALSVALLAAGVWGVAVHHPARHLHGGSAAAGSVATAGAGRAAAGPPAAGLPGPGSASLQAGLIVPQDMGGYYSTSSAAAATFLDSAPCLASLQPSPAEDGRAATALLNLEDSGSVPVIVEEVASYPGSEATGVYGAVTSALGTCPAFSFAFNGAHLSTSLTTSTIPPVGDADRVWTATFSSGGASYVLQLGVVLDGQQVLVVVWIDSAARSNAIMGSFASTVSLAIGELA